MVKSKKTACIIIAQNYQKHIQSFFVGLQSVLRIHRVNIILITTLMDFGDTLKTPKLPFWEDNVKNNIDFTCMVQLHFQSLSTLSCKAIVIFNSKYFRCFNPLPNSSGTDEIWKEQEILPSPSIAFCQASSVNSRWWRIQGERAGNTSPPGPLDLKWIGRTE